MQNADIRKVHVVFKTHLDIGFTDLAHVVVDEYMQHFIPKALHTAEILARSDRPEQFVWTSGAWLLHTYLERANPEQRAKLEQAIRQGWIVWHALPFTPHSEFLGADLFREGLHLSQELDARFGRRTIAAKTTDVPGNTRAIVPLLAEAGVRLLHVGVNGAVAVPDVPPTFRWRDPSGAELVVLYSGEYGGVTVVPGLDEALAVEFTRDNLGPHTPEAVVMVFRQFMMRFPHAQIVASSLDAFAHVLIDRQVELPLVTAEIGDTWIHGVGTDPTKVSQFRELCRLQATWQAASQATAEELQPFRRSLMLVGEHTWGLDSLAHLGDHRRYQGAAFAYARTLPNFQAMETSWREQRQYIDTAVSLLPLPLAAQATTALAAIRPCRPTHEGWIEQDPALATSTAMFDIGFDAETGAITHLLDRSTGKQWATSQQPLGVFSYETFSAQDHQDFIHDYIRPSFWKEWWVADQFARPGGERQRWFAHVQRIVHVYDPDAHRWLIELGLPAVATQSYGAPTLITLEVTIPHTKPQITFDLQWFEKSACRLAEAAWLSFSPVFAEPYGWMLDKLGSSVDPLDVVARGARTLHVVERGVSYRGRDGALDIDTLDAPLVAPGMPTLLRFRNTLPALDGGMHFNLYNNIWNTNFPLWYADDARFRFVLTFPQA